MKSRVNVLEIELNNNTAKEAMQKVMEYMQTEPMNIVEIISADTLVKSKDNETLKDNIAQADLVLAGEQAVLGGCGSYGTQEIAGCRLAAFCENAFTFFS